MIALITGASRGIGKGVALALAQKGYDLVVTGRSKPNLEALKRSVESFGRTCLTLVCDHADFGATVWALKNVEGTTFDIVVNNAWGGYEAMHEAGTYTWEKKFWDQPDHRWVSMMDVGVRTAFLTSRHCARNMVAAQKGLIVNISFWAARKYMQNVIYGVSKAAIDKMTADMAEEARPYGVSVVSLYPGLVRTEGVMENASYFDLSNSESPEFQGLVIEALSRDPSRSQKSGGFYTSAELAKEYGIVDIDGKAIREDRLA